MIEKTVPTKTLLDDLKATLKSAHANLETIPASVQAAHQIARREAQDRLPQVRARYQQRVLSNVVFFFTSGPKDKEREFAAVAAADGVPFSVDVDDLFEAIAVSVEPTVGSSREFGIHQVVKMGEAIEKLVPQFQYTMPKLYELAVTPTHDDLRAHVRTLCQRTFGATLATSFIEELLTVAAVSADFSGKALPAVIMGTDGDLRQNLRLRCAKIRSADVELAADTVVDKSFAMSVFKDAKANASKS